VSVPILQCMGNSSLNGSGLRLPCACVVI
jgi:hypothetical protein